MLHDHRILGKPIPAENGKEIHESIDFPKAKEASDRQEKGNSC